MGPLKKQPSGQLLTCMGAYSLDSYSLASYGLGSYSLGFCSLDLQLWWFLSAFSRQSDVQNSQKQKFSKWAALVQKVLADLMATFSARLEPPQRP